MRPMAILAMNPESSRFWLSAIDEERFGFRTARATAVTADTLGAVIEFCRANGVHLLIARCPAADLSAVHAMENDGFALMDTLVYYARDLARTSIPPDTGKAAMRPVRDGEEEAVGVIAQQAFRGYFGHYHADSRLDRSKCDEVYASWASNCCSMRGPASEVLVAELGSSLVGFAALRMNAGEEAEVVLNGVIPSARGRGIYRSLVLTGMEWSRRKGARVMLGSTHLANLAVQRVWTRLGFELRSAYHTFHKWFGVGDTAGPGPAGVAAG